MCAGVVPGYCHSTNLTVGLSYVILLDERDGYYEPTNTEFHATDQKLAELATACGLQTVYPRGMYDIKKLNYRRETARQLRMSFYKAGSHVRCGISRRS